MREKENFYKYRVLSFSDVVFSNEMTLPVLEFGIPSYKALQTNSTLKILQNRIPSFIGLVVSFMITALYWVVHLRIFVYTSSIDSTILWYNIVLLFFIVLLPFSTAFCIRGFSHKGPFVFYCFNVSAIGFFNYLLNIYVPRKQIGHTGITPTLAKYFKLRAINAFLVWAIVGLLAFYTPMIATFLFIFLFSFEFILSTYFKRKLIKEATIE